MTLPPNHPTIPTPKVGVLLINLGTPDAPDAGSVRRYLGEFLSDRRVVELPPILWQPILRGIILTTRPKKSAHAYQQVWTDQGSPLAFHTRDTALALAEAMVPTVTVDWAMRYGNPSIASRLSAMKKAGCDRILLAPLYPQYSGATTATANDAAFAALKAMERTLHLGDPYHCQSVKTVRLLREALTLPVHMSFQSRFGRAKWLEPETEATLAGLVRDGVRNIAVVTPGFSADCLETLEEIALRAKEAFLSAGGEKFAYLPCLNASPDAITLYQRLIGRELSGWIDQPA